MEMPPHMVVRYAGKGLMEHSPVVFLWIPHHPTAAEPYSLKRMQQLKTQNL